jgi:hypothetical protein
MATQPARRLPRHTDRTRTPYVHASGQRASSTHCMMPSQATHRALASQHVRACCVFRPAGARCSQPKALLQLGQVVEQHQRDHRVRRDAATRCVRARVEGCVAGRGGRVCVSVGWRRSRAGCCRAALRVCCRSCALLPPTHLHTHAHAHAHTHTHRRALREHTHHTHTHTHTHDTHRTRYVGKPV